MSNIEDSLKEQIKKHLPEMAAKEMAEYISNAEKIKKELEKANSNFIQLEKSKELVMKKNEELAAENQKLINEAIDVQKQKAANFEYAKHLEETQIRLEVDKLQIRLDEANRRHQDVRELALAAFKNPTVKQTVLGERISTYETVSNQYDGRGGNIPVVTKHERTEPTQETTIKEIE